MITLITGVPGVGKTALTVKELLRLKGSRPVFSNINGLKIDHHTIDHEWVQTWHLQAPPDALIVIDEAQHSFRPRPQGSKVPDNVAAFETHRHLGVDMILVTQRPTLIDANIRGLVGRYLHIRQTSLSRMVHEAMEVVDFSQKSVREENAKTAYKLPKEVFSLYKSSELHTKKPRPKLPTAVYILGALVPIIGVTGFYLYGSISSKLAPSKPTVEAARGGGLPPTLPSDRGSVDHGQRLQLAMLPIDPENPLSAPIYAESIPPVVAPEIQICVASAAKCSCYSQQTTPVWVPEEQCRQRAAGQYYDPYKQPQNDRDDRYRQPDTKPNQEPEIESTPAVQPDSISPMGVVADRAARGVL